MDPSWHTFAVQSDGREELVDIVDSGDRVIKSVSRAVMRRDVLRHRAVFILVRDGEGRVLVHRRSSDKDLWPGWWDIGGGGVVAGGVSYAAAARRELFEEAGIAAEPVLVSSGAYEDTDVSLIARCYEVRHDGAVEARDGEVAEFRWVSVAELRDLVSRERFLPDSLALLGPGLFGG
jgi:8-oxo-dGTP pyrophosphatase MutT (NUDIX family)